MPPGRNVKAGSISDDDPKVVAGSIPRTHAPGEPLDALDGADEAARRDPTSHPVLWLGNGLILFVALGALMLSIGPGVYTIDEAAYRFQAETVSEEGWGLPYPTDGLVTQDLGAPLVNAELGPDRWFPAARHPAYVQLVRASIWSGERVGLGGFYGPIVLSIIGVVLAAFGIERLSRWLGGAPNWFGFWIAGLAGPAAFHGLVAWAHAPALGLAAVGLAFILVAPPSDESAVDGRTVLGALAIAGAVLLRGEAPIMVVAIVLALLAASTFDRRYLSRSVVVGLTAVAAFALTTVWHGLVVGPNAVSGAGTGRGFDLGRYAHAAFEILLSPGSSGPGTFRLIAAALLPVTVIWVRRNGEHDVVTAYILAGGAVVAGIIGSLQPAAYGALLPAFPLLALGLSALEFRAPDGPTETWEAPQWQRAVILGVAAIVATLGPIVASVSGGGGLGWGGRYVLFASIATVPLVAAGCGTLWRRSDTKPLLVAAVLVTATVQVSGFRTLHGYHRLSLEATDEITAALAPLPNQVELIIAVDARVGRLAPHAATSAPLISAALSEDATELLRRAEADGLRRVAIISYERPVEVPLPSPWREVAYKDEAVQIQVVQR